MSYKLLASTSLCDIPLPWPIYNSPPHPGISHQATEELPELCGILQQTVTELAPLLLALAHHLLLHECPQVLARHQELALCQQKLGRGELLALGITWVSDPNCPEKGRGERGWVQHQAVGTTCWEAPWLEGQRRELNLGETLTISVVVPSGLFWRIWVLWQTQQRLQPLHPAPQHGTQLPNLLALQTSSHLKDALQQPYHEDGFPDAGEVLCILVNHFAHAADELGPRQPLAGRQLQAEGLKEAEEQHMAPCIALLLQQLPAAGRHNIPQLLLACCLASMSYLPCKTPKPPLPPRSQHKNRRVA